MPSAPPALMQPTAMILSYRRLIMAGRAISPMETVATELMPAMAAKRAQITTVPMARPPRTRPIQRWTISYNSSARPLNFRMLAMKMNNGMAMSKKLVPSP